MPLFLDIFTCRGIIENLLFAIIRYNLKYSYLLYIAAVQVAILVAIAIGLGLLFKEHITNFIEDTFLGLTQSGF